MRVLVTGASGHVGGAVMRRLIDDGHAAVGLSRRWRKVPGAAGWLLADLGRAGLADRATAELGRCDAIVHAAAAIDHAPHAPAVTAVNAFGTQQVVELAESWGAALVYISGVPVIGRPRTLPVTEEHPVDPPTAYHASKLFGEHLVELAGRRGLVVASLRLTSPVGPGMPDGRILSVFVRRALAGEPLLLAGSGGRRQDYVDVRDVADAVAACLLAHAEGLFNVAAGRSVSNRELAERVVAVCGGPSSIALTGAPDPDEQVAWEVSIERAATAFGYAPACSLEDSIAAVAAEIAASDRGRTRRPAPSAAAAERRSTATTPPRTGNPS